MMATPSLKVRTTNSTSHCYLFQFLTFNNLGFGHICVSVDDLDAACKRFEEKGVSWKKRLTDGRMKNVAFVLDPDGEQNSSAVKSDGAFTNFWVGLQAIGLRSFRTKSTSQHLGIIRHCGDMSQSVMCSTQQGKKKRIVQTRCQSAQSNVLFVVGTYT